ncbi:hypothetical protein B0T18DRAFT_407902 [Schizothecium vesticola]|uniref:Uncharacterized protein n=1 Tax=Schizothecium vesticola TaxID=314040 RepID=A0AA40K921_9PEZI|nr:hypothetical protein B0T18DRAFT_407902 [Schizothecium vesticola]
MLPIPLVFFFLSLDRITAQAPPATPRPVIDGLPRTGSGQLQRQAMTPRDVTELSGSRGSQRERANPRGISPSREAGPFPPLRNVSGWPEKANGGPAAGDWGSNIENRPVDAQ